MVDDEGINVFHQMSGGLQQQMSFQWELQTTTDLNFLPSGKNFKIFKKWRKKQKGKKEREEGI
jgi:hypothetical protein